jgi:hypothetical protein
VISEAEMWRNSTIVEAAPKLDLDARNYCKFVASNSPGACRFLFLLWFTPERPAGWRDPNHGSSLDRHLPILRILPAQASHGSSMGCAPIKDFCLAKDQNIGEVIPNLAVAIDQQRGLRIRLNVDQSLELRRARSLWLLVNRRVEMFSIKNKADGYDVRLTVKASGSEMGNPRGMNKPQLRRREA